MPLASSIRSLRSVELVSWEPSTEIGVLEFGCRDGGGVTPLSNDDDDCVRVGGLEVGVDFVLMARMGFLRFSVGTIGIGLLLYGSSGRGLS